MANRWNPVMVAERVIPEKWIPLSWAAGGDFAELVKTTMPGLHVGTGAAAFVDVSFNSDTTELKITLKDEASPWLPAAALEVWVLVQWPETFRRGRDGKAPE